LLTIDLVDQRKHKEQCGDWRSGGWRSMKTNRRNTTKLRGRNEPMTTIRGRALSVADRGLMMDRDEDRQAKLANLTNCKAQGEKRYDEMYEAYSFGHAGACYSDAKELQNDAMSEIGPSRRSRKGLHFCLFRASRFFRDRDDDGV
jgi:hypothetical protein